MPSIAIFSYEPHQKIWGSLHHDTRSPTRPEKEVEDKKEDGKKEEDLECELQLSLMDVDKVLVNGVELTLATLRAACSFLGDEELAVQPPLAFSP